jgi:hypothetical protein
MYLGENGGLGGNALEWDRSRGNDFRCLAQSLFSMAMYPGLKGVPSISQLEKWLSNPEELPSKFCENAHLTYRVFQELVRDPKFSTPFRKPTKVSPIEFILATLLISLFKDKLTLVQLSEALGGLRDGVRREHVDIRMNARVSKTMLDYIRGLKINKLPSEPASVTVDRKRKRNPLDDSINGPPKSRPKISVAPQSSSSRRSVSPDIPLAARQHLGHHMHYAPLPPPPPPLPPPTVAPDRLAALRAAKQNILPIRPASGGVMPHYPTPMWHPRPGIEPPGPRHHEQERNYRMQRPPFPLGGAQLRPGGGAR